MAFKKLLQVFAFLFGAQALFGQDIHFTMYNMSPMTLNPAMAGKFEGTFRIGGIYRDQWSSVISNQFRTPSAWVDAPIIRGFRKQDWIGVGLMLYQDKAGIAALTHSAAKLGGAYHFAFGKKGNTVLSIGGHYGSEQRRINPEQLIFQDGLELNNVGLSQDLARVLGNANYQDFDGGLAFTTRLNPKMDMTLGFSMYHIGRPRYNLLNDGFERLPRRAVTHGVFNIEMNEKWTLSPSFIYQTMSGADEIMVQGLAGYLFNEEKAITLQGGLGYRLSDAVNLLAGARIKDLTLGISYDVNTSSLSNVSNYRGGFEIAANYIVKIYKPSVVKPKILCPRF